MTRRRRGTGILVALVPLLLLAGAALTDPAARVAHARDSASATGEHTAPWLRGAFAASADEMLRASERAMADAGELLASNPSALVLFHDASYTFDATGRAIFRRHWIYRVLDQASVAEWSELEVRWSPWHQALPTIEARVIGTDGGERRLAPDDLEEKAERRGRPDDRPAGRADPDRRRWLLASLPEVTDGSVVEVVTEVRDLGPAFDSGIAARHYFVMFVPMLHSRFRLDVSKRLPLRYALRKMPPDVEPTTEQTAERFRLLVEARSMPAAAGAPEGLPGYVPRYPHVVFSTGRDWARVAARYGHLVERVLHPDLAALDAELGGAVDTAAVSHSDPVQRIDAILQLVRRRLVHDGSELEASPPGPRRLSVILEEGRGNAVDLAAVLVAALRRAGIRAHAALIDAGFGVDAEAGMPGLGMFNHVVVRVPEQLVEGGPLPGLWIDAGAPYVRAGELPLVDQGRLALVASPDTERLETLPTTTPDDNLAFEQREIFLREWGPADMVETSRYQGSAEQTQRAVTGGLDGAARRRGYLAYVRAFHGAAELGRVQESQADDLDEPFQLELEVLGASVAATGLDRAQVVIPIGELTRRLPQIFRAPLEDPRTEEFVFHEPFATAWSYVIHPPTGFVAGDLPPDESVELGPGIYRQSFWVADNAGGSPSDHRQTIQGSLRFDVGQRRLTADQFERMHAALRAFGERPDVLVEMVPAAEKVADPAERLRLLTSFVSAEPAGAAHRVRLVPALLDLGLVSEARQQARDVVEQVPSWAPGHWALGLALAHDDLGRFGHAGAELESARESLRTARALGPDDPRAEETLARLAQAPEAGRTSALAAPASPGAAPEAAPDAETVATRTQPGDFHPDDPKTPLLRLLRLLPPEGSDGAGVSILPVLHPRERQRLRRDGVDGYLSRLRSVTRPQDVEIDGAPHLGYRLELAAAGGVGKLFVTPAADQGQGELLVSALDASPAALGREAVARLWQGDLQGARRWLDWALEEGGDGKDSSSFRHLWPPEDAKEPTAEELRLAAAALASSADFDGEALAWLRAAVDSGEGIAPVGRGYGQSQAETRRRAARLALIEAQLASGDQRGAVQRIGTLAGSGATGDVQMRDTELDLYVGLGDWRSVERLLQSSGDAERAPERRTTAVLRARAALSAARGEAGDAAELWQLLHERGELRDEDALRWTALLLAPGVANASSDLRTLDEHVRRTADPQLLRRVAALLADAGRAADAHRMLLDAAEPATVHRLRPADRFTQARVAESCGLVDAARRLYAELVAGTGSVQPDAPKSEDALLFRRLAQARLARLSFG